MGNFIPMKKLFLFLSLGYFSCTFSQTTDYSFIYNPEGIFAKGVELHDSEKYAEAIKEYDKIAKIDPQYLRAQYEKAMSLSALEKKEELKALFEDLYQNNQMASYPTLYVLYGSFLSDEKEYEKSEKIFLEGEKLLPNSSNLLYNMAILYARKEENQKSVDLLKRIILNNPNHASAHFLLGSFAFDNGKITEGTLALMSYLIIAPNGRFAEKAILKLNSKFGENFLENGKTVFSKTGDNFEEIDIILRNQLPLKKAYKVKSEFDDVIIRQVQAVAEYTTEHKMGNGFFETTYIPWIKMMVERNLFEGYSYYILLSMEEKLGKKLVSQKKTITSFYENFILKDFWYTYSLRNLEHFGKQEEVNIFLENGYPNLIGSFKNEKKEGKFKLLDDNGNLEGELNFKNDELDGLQKYYDEKGKLEKERNFVNGKLDGTTKEYYKNGQISLIENYKNDLLNGISSSYYTNGGKKCEVNFTDGERNGDLICLFENGSKKSENVYVKGKLNGVTKIYNAVGDLTETYAFENDLIIGDYKEYLDGKIVKSEAIYKNGKVDGTYKKYYNNGVLERQNFYENGKLKKIINYYTTGTISYETLYDSKEEIESYTFYDSKQNKYFEEKFKSGELKSGIQYTKKSPKPTTVNLSKKPFVMYTYEGEPFITGAFEKGRKTNEWKYNYPNGNLRLSENYIQGKQNGLSHNYNKNGLLNSINYCVNDTLNGVYENYDNGILKGIYHYHDGKLNGPFKTFNRDKSLVYEGYYNNDEISSERINYWQDGTISSQETFLEGILISTTVFNPKGEKEYTVDYKNRTGKFSSSLYNGTALISYEMVNGEYNGKYIAKDKLNNTIVELEYVNGIRNNSYKSYNPNGTLAYDRTYYCGKINGIDKQYDLVGNHRITDEYIYGEEYNKTTRFYHNKSKMYEYNQLESTYEGDYTYFNQKGEALLILNYLNGSLQYYIKKNSAGELNEKVTVENETADITSFYSNGKVAIKINFIKGGIEGRLFINNNEGKVEYEANFKNNIFDGERIEYYSNGKIYKKERLTNGDFEGAQEYFKEDGKPWLTANYKNDDLHGKTLIYTNGTLSVTKIYNSNELVEIIK